MHNFFRLFNNFVRLHYYGNEPVLKRRPTWEGGCYVKSNSHSEEEALFPHLETQSRTQTQQNG